MNNHISFILSSYQQHNQALALHMARSCISKPNVPGQVGLSVCVLPGGLLWCSAEHVQLLSASHRPALELSAVLVLIYTCYLSFLKTRVSH